MQCNECNEALKQKYKERSDKNIYLSENATASVLRKHRLTKNKKCMGMQNNATKNQQNHSSKEDLINTNTVSLK